MVLGLALSQLMSLGVVLFVLDMVCVIAPFSVRAMLDGPDGTVPSPCALTTVLGKVSVTMGCATAKWASLEWIAPNEYVPMIAQARVCARMVSVAVRWGGVVRTVQFAIAPMHAATLVSARLVLDACAILVGLVWTALRHRVQLTASAKVCATTVPVVAMMDGLVLTAPKRLVPRNALETVCATLIQAHVSVCEGGWVMIAPSPATTRTLSVLQCVPTSAPTTVRLTSSCMVSKADVIATSTAHSHASCRAQGSLASNSTAFPLRI